MIADGSIIARPGDEDPGAIALMRKLAEKSRSRWPAVGGPDRAGRACPSRRSRPRPDRVAGSARGAGRSVPPDELDCDLVHPWRARTPWPDRPAPTVGHRVGVVGHGAVDRAEGGAVEVVEEALADVAGVGGDGRRRRLVGVVVRHVLDQPVIGALAGVLGRQRRPLPLAGAAVDEVGLGGRVVLRRRVAGLLARPRPATRARPRGQPGTANGSGTCATTQPRNMPTRVLDRGLAVIRTGSR